MSTYREKIITGLKLMGCIQVPSGSRYVTFNYPGFKSGQLFFVGASGALRKGPNASNSVSIGCPADKTPFYVRVLQAADDGFFRACVTCQHFQHDRPSNVGIAKDEAARYPNWCSKQAMPTGELRLRCGGDDYLKPGAPAPDRLSDVPKSDPAQ